MFDLSPMTRNSPIYLDYNAATPCAPEVVDEMLPFLGSVFGNASSVHLMGRNAAKAIADAREAVAKSIKCDSEELVFTSGATEANNLTLLGVTLRKSNRKRIVLTAIEHKSVIEPARWLAEQGFDIVHIPVSSDGVVDIEAAEELINTHTRLVSIQGANNEIGTIQPVAELAEIAHSCGALVHSDATQMLGKVDVSVDQLGVDFASFSAHKLYGPKGIGALFIRRRRGIEPVYRGGGQEHDIRPGTLNVPGAVGFGAACRLIDRNKRDAPKRISDLRSLCEEHLLQSFEEAFVIGESSDRLPGTTSVCIPGVPSDALLARTPQVCAGIGAACTSGAIEPSHVLQACGLTRDLARCVIRISIGEPTTRDEVLVASKLLSKNARDILSASSAHS